MASEITWESKGVMQRFFGLCDNEDLRKSLCEILGHPRYDDVRYVIYDFLDVHQCRCEMPAVEEAAAISSAASLSNERVKVAIVATQPRVVAWAPTFIDISGRRYPTRLFSTVDAARAWAVGPNG